MHTHSLVDWSVDSDMFGERDWQINKEESWSVLIFSSQSRPLLLHIKHDLVINGLTLSKNLEAQIENNPNEMNLIRCI